MMFVKFMSCFDEKGDILEDGIYSLDYLHKDIRRQ